MDKRKIVKEIKIGNIAIGGHEKVAIQSMLNCPSDDIESNLNQALALATAGCDIIRVAVPNEQSTELVRRLKSHVNTPIVADIHFDYRLAILACQAGADKIRINPGNIGGRDKLQAVVDVCSDKNIPIRVGVNSGSVEKNLLLKYGGPTAQAMCESALGHIELLESMGFYNTVISIKSSDVRTMVEAYRLISDSCDYPLHLGVTEAGTEKIGTIKSSIGIGTLLLDGIGDTIRVSLSADQVQEVYTAKAILKTVGLYDGGVEIISCPTCGRTKIDIISLAQKTEEALKNCEKNIKVAVMGCAVNGPGEAREADIGIAGGNGEGIIFAKGKIIKKVPEDKLFDELVNMINKF